MTQGDRYSTDDPRVRLVEDVIGLTPWWGHNCELCRSRRQACPSHAASAIVGALDAYTLSDEYLKSPAARLSAASIRAHIAGEISVAAIRERIARDIEALAASAVEWDAPAVGHYAGCWKSHPECVLFLAADIARGEDRL